MGKETSIIFACLPALIGPGGIMAVDLNNGTVTDGSSPVLPLLLVTSLLVIILLTACLYYP